MALSQHTTAVDVPDASVPAQQITVPAHSVVIGSVPVPDGPLVEDGITLAAGQNVLDARSATYATWAVNLTNQAPAINFSNVIPWAVLVVWVKRTVASGPPAVGIIWDSRLRRQEGSAYPGPTSTVGAWSVFTFQAVPDGAAVVLALMNHRTFTTS